MFAVGVGGLAGWRIMVRAHGGPTLQSGKQATHVSNSGRTTKSTKPGCDFVTPGLSLSIKKETCAGVSTVKGRSNVGQVAPLRQTPHIMPTRLCVPSKHGVASRACGKNGMSQACPVAACRKHQSPTGMPKRVSKACC